MDVLVLAPESGHPRTVNVRDLGTVENDWIAREFILAYFEGDGISPPVRILFVSGFYVLKLRVFHQLKKRVVEKLELQK